MRLTSKSAPVTGRQSAKGVVVNLREYMPQHWETVSSCTCCINKVSLEFKCLSGNKETNMSI